MAAQPRGRRRRPEFSQHFLRKGALAARLVETSSVSLQDLVIEIGPGAGALTRHLADRCRELIAVELDPDLCRELRACFAGIEGLRIVHGDFLCHRLPRTPYKVFGNLPYASTTEIVRRLDAAPTPPIDAYLVVQREAALRFAGAPYARETRLSLLLKPWWQVEILHWMRRTDFEPPPAVDSVQLWLARRVRPLITSGEARSYRDFVSAAFRGRGWTVRDRLRHALTPPQLARLGRELRFNPGAASQTLRFDQWLAVFRFVASSRGRGQSGSCR